MHEEEAIACFAKASDYRDNLREECRALHTANHHRLQASALIEVDRLDDEGAILADTMREEQDDLAMMQSAMVVCDKDVSTVMFGKCDPITVTKLIFQAEAVLLLANAYDQASLTEISQRFLILHAAVLDMKGRLEDVIDCARTCARLSIELEAILGDEDSAEVFDSNGETDCNGV